MFCVDVVSSFLSCYCLDMLLLFFFQKGKIYTVIGFKVLDKSQYSVYGHEFRLKMDATTEVSEFKGEFPRVTQSKDTFIKLQSVLMLKNGTGISMYNVVVYLFR